VSISSDDDTYSTVESDGEYNSDHDSDVDMCMQDDMDAPCSIDLDGDADMARDGDNEKEDDQEEEDEEEKDEEYDDEDEEQDEDEDDGNEPRTIGQGEMVNLSADNVDTIIDDHPIVLPEQGQEMREHTPRPQPPPSAPRPHTLELHP